MKKNTCIEKIKNNKSETGKKLSKTTRLFIVILEKNVLSVPNFR
jgi:hypothetical protein